MDNGITRTISNKWGKVLNGFEAISKSDFAGSFFGFFIKIMGFVGGVLVLSMLLIESAEAETRSLKLYYVHTNERAEIIFKKNGRYVASGLKKLNYFLRDWRRNEPTNMDPHLFDVLWQIYKESGARSYIHVVSAYRAPSTNNMLRLKSANSGVAKDSQHTLGKAMDFYIPDVKLERLRQIGLKLEAGGVGYYPKSGSPFIHVDVGNVRHWPRMNRQELMALFPDGKTIHTPSDGKPLAGYQLAMNTHLARKNKAKTPQLVQKNQPVQKEGEKKSLFAAIFNKKKNKNPVDAPIAVATNVRSSGGNKGEKDFISLPDEHAPMPMASPLRAQPNNRLEEDDIDRMVASQERDAAVEVAQITTLPPLPPAKPVVQKPITSSDTTVNNEDEIAAPSQLAYLPQLVKQTQDASPHEAIEIIIAQGDEVEVIPLPDEDLYDEDSTSISSLITQQDIRHTQQASDADKDIIRQVIADAVASLEEADPQTVSSISKAPDPAPASSQRAPQETVLTVEGEEIRQIPKIVFVSRLQKQEKRSHMAQLSGRAITFSAVTHIHP